MEYTFFVDGVRHTSTKPTARPSMILRLVKKPTHRLTSTWNGVRHVWDEEILLLDLAHFETTND